MANDHFVARTYLKRWCDRASKQPIQAYRKPGGEHFPCWPEAVCTEASGDLNPRYFQDPNVLGQFREIFEPRWDAAIDAVENRNPTADDKFVIAGYWANLIAATPAWRQIGRELYEREIQSILPIITKDHPAPENVKLSVEVDEDYIKKVATQHLLAGALQLYHQQWTILTNNTADEFLTSDNPSAVYPPSIPGGPVVQILPISPQLCISTMMDQSATYKKDVTREDLTAPPKGGVTYQAIVPEGVKLANRLVVVNAQRFVFARTANSGIAALVKKCGDYSAQLEHSVEPTPADDGIMTQARLFIGKKK